MKIVNLTKERLYIGDKVLLPGNSLECAETTYKSIHSDFGSSIILTGRGERIISNFGSLKSREEKTGEIIVTMCE